MSNERERARVNKYIGTRFIVYSQHHRESCCLYKTRRHIFFGVASFYRYIEM